MIPFCDFKRELKYKQETMEDVLGAVFLSILLIACVFALIVGIVQNNTTLIVGCSLLTLSLAWYLALHICWAVRDYKKYKFVREMNKTAFEIKVLNVLMSAIIEVATRKDKEKATKTTTKKKATRKRK